MSLDISAHIERTGGFNLSVDLTIATDRVTALYGASGSGKTTLALAVARLVPVTSGSILMNGAQILDIHGDALRNERRSMQFIFKDLDKSIFSDLRFFEGIASM